MKRYLVVITILALVAILVTGCAGTPSPTPTPTAPPPTPTPASPTPAPASPTPAPASPTPTPASPTPTPASPTPAPTLPAGVGMLEVRVTDAPPEYGTIKEILVTVVDSEEAIMVHKAVAEQEQLGEGDQNQVQNQVQQGEGEWINIPITGENPFDLLELKEKGVDLLLGWAEVPAGKYTQIRMTIEQVEIIFEGATEAEGDDETKIAKLPSGNLKFVRPFNVVDGETTIILLDFIADKSVTITGQGNVIFKPVIKLEVSGKGKPVELESSLETTGDATAESSSEEAHSGNGSVHLETTGTEGAGDEARIVIPLPEDTILSDIESISWWTYLVEGYIPHVDLELDLDADSNSENDRLVAEAAHQNDNDATTWDTSYRGEDVSWIQTFEGASGVYTSWANWITGSPSLVTSVNDTTAMWMFAADDATYRLDTLANFKSGIGDVDADTVVLAIEVEIDNWVLQSEAYVDDIEIVIGGETYTVGL